MNFGISAPFFAISITQSRFQRLDRPGTQKIHGRPAESTAGHPGSKDSWDLQRGLHQKIQLGAGYFVIVAKAPVRFRCQTAQALGVAPIRRLYEFLYATIFGDYVPRALQ